MEGEGFEGGEKRLDFFEGLLVLLFYVLIEVGGFVPLAVEFEFWLGARRAYGDTLAVVVVEFKDYDIAWVSSRRGGREAVDYFSDIVSTELLGWIIA